MQTQQIAIEKVSSVYSGRDGKCCCGCAGKHTYSSKHRAWASKDRGYKVTDEEIRDTTVTTIVNKINAELAANNVDTYADGFVSTVVGNRLYIAYLVH